MTEASIQFHIEENDYFGTLATVIDLVSQDLRRKGHQNNAESVGTLVTYPLKHHSLTPTDPTEALDPSVRAELVKLFCFFLRS
jgi:hypothetical protein